MHYPKVRDDLKALAKVDSRYELKIQADEESETTAQMVGRDSRCALYWRPIHSTREN
jgi:hypothetical protein